MVHKSQKAEATIGSTGGRTDARSVVHAYKRVSFSLKKNGILPHAIT